MRKTLLASAIVLFATIAMAQGRNDGRTPFVTSDEAPKLERILPPPPGLTDSRFYDDWSQYQWGLSMRATERGLQARSDAFLNASYFIIRSGGKTFITFLFDSCYCWAVSIPVAYSLSAVQGSLVGARA